MIHYFEAEQPVYGQLRQRILDGRLPPGTALSLDTLGELIEPDHLADVEGAVEFLKAEGLVVGSADVLNVRRWTRKEVKDLYGLRAMLEVHAARLCALRADDQDVHAIVEAAERFKQTLDAGQLEANIHADVQLHLAVARGSGVFGLARMLSEQIAFRGSMTVFCLSINTKRLMASSVRDCHDALVEAIRLRDPDLAAQAAQNHVDVALARCLGRNY